MLSLLTSWRVAFVLVKKYSLKVLSSFLPMVSSKSLLQGLVSVSRMILQHSLSEAERTEKRTQVFPTYASRDLSGMILIDVS